MMAVPSMNGFMVLFWFLDIVNDIIFKRGMVWKLVVDVVNDKEIEKNLFLYFELFVAIFASVIEK